MTEKDQIKLLWKLLDNPEYRLQAPAVSAEAGQWVLFREAEDQLSWSNKLQVATEEMVNVRNNDGTYGSSKSNSFRARLFSHDFVWAGDLPQLLTILVNAS